MNGETGKKSLDETAPGDGGRTVEARFEALLEAAVDAIVVIGDDGRIQTFSPAAERLFGYRADEVQGKNVSTLMPGPFQSEHDGYLHNYLDSGIPKIIGIGREVRAFKKDGTIFPIDLSEGLETGGRGLRFSRCPRAFEVPHDRA